jgi:hypothetical protein
MLNAYVKFAGLSTIAVCLSLAAVEAQAAAAARPDFTGVWTNAGRPALGGTTGPRGAQALPLKPEPKAKVDAYRALVTPTGDTPGGYCLGYGMPQSMLSSGGYPMEIIQRPEQITVIYEAHSETRRIYFGARNAAPEDRVPGRNGYSSGRWEGNTLVVETDNLVEQVDESYPHSDQAKIVERYHEEKGPAGERILVAEMTLTDPVFYTEPVKAEKRWQQVPNGRLLPYECAEENWHKRLEELRAKAAAK